MESSRRYTVSVAVPVSCLNEAGNLQLKSALVYQIARLAIVYEIDEIILVADPESVQQTQNATASSDCYIRDPLKFFSDILGYMETPTFMRKTLFPLLPHLKYMGLFPVIQLRNDSSQVLDKNFPYKEGYVLNQFPRSKNKYLVHAGFEHPVQVTSTQPLSAKDRLTIRMKPQAPNAEGYLQGDIVSCTAPREKGGRYWGFQIRHSSSLSDLLKGPYKGGYDLKVQINNSTHVSPADLSNNLESSFRHVLLLFGNAYEDQRVDDLHTINPFPFVLPIQPRLEENFLAAMAPLSSVLKCHGRH
ncbi:SPOUT domain containing methyltransferase [Schizosaccharomyces osmophilus]|uniref:SPOUT domain containing methyltransferase n=1 Tax=Schizosaccharomyces osmophilus TaxID=2545709 RepID=A0AAE9W7R7_9SCHI|nr:SPOUT domain containing methyltransferase [Schizosaccharomyces osmophilus]WBW70945.1 SPOUT domain containing methyltransferase [Schizosaccharomyces osmophilus]